MNQAKVLLLLVVFELPNQKPDSGRTPTPHFPLLSSICKTAIYMKSIETQGAKRPIRTKKNIVTNMWQG